MKARLALVSSLLLALCLLPITVFADVYKVPSNGNDLVGKTFTVKAKRGDSITRIANRYNVGLHEIREANPRFRNKLRVGTEVVVPKQFILPSGPRKGIVINMAELRIYYYTPDGNQVYTFPVALGRQGWRSPIMRTTISRKKRNPTWHVPESIREDVYMNTGNILPESIPPGPENPLGRYALYLKKAGYLIHGNNAEWTVGRLISSGCIRMHNADIKKLFNLVPVGTPVRIVHHAQKAGWSDGRLYLEAHLPIRLAAPEGELNHNSQDVAIANATRHRTADVDWSMVKQVVRASRGIPTVVGGEG